MDAELAELCAETFTIEPQTTADKSAKPGYGAAVTYQGRGEIKEQYRRAANGDLVMTKGRVILVPVPGAALPRTGIDRLTMPSTYLVRQPPIVDVNSQVDEFGNVDHLVVYFG